MNKKKVCMIVYTIYPYDARVRREAETLAASGRFEVIVLCLKENGRAISYLKEMITVKELNLRKYAGNSKFRYIISYLKFLIKASFACSLLFFQRAIDIVHVHNMPNFLVFAAIIPRLFGKTLILDMHDSVPDTFAAKFSGKGSLLFRILCLEEKISCWLSNKVICVNYVQKEVAVGRGIPSEKIYISMNVPDHKKFYVHRDLKDVQKENGQLKLVYHGTMAERLGVDLVIEAMTRLNNQIPGVELHLWGAGDYVDSIYNQYVELWERELVFLHGLISLEELPGVLAGMDIGIIPNRKSSTTELMLPVKMMEYAALEIPIVAPKLKAIQYYFTAEMVSYFEPDNIDSMIEAIVKLYKDKSLRKSQIEETKGFLEKYGWETQSKDFINFYLGMK